MDLKIQNKNENKAFSRTEVIAKVNFNKATPSRKDIQKAIAKEVKGKEELTIINQIKTAFGNSSAIITATIYTDAEVMKRLERKNLIDKHVVAKEEPKKEEEDSEPKKETEPAEEKKEKVTEEAPVEKKQNTDSPEAE